MERDRREEKKPEGDPPLSCTLSKVEEAGMKQGPCSISGVVVSSRLEAGELGEVFPAPGWGHQGRVQSVKREKMPGDSSAGRSMQLATAEKSQLQVWVIGRSLSEADAEPPQCHGDQIDS